MKILICTIIRNQHHNIISWYNQIKEIVTQNENIEFYLSAYENNSTDNTKDILKNFNFDFFKGFNVVSEDIPSTPFFKGGYEPYGEESKIRVKLLSECRNKCFEPSFVEESDYVLFIEPDITYNPKIFNDILDFIVKNNYDIVSAISYTSGQHYDKWGTRINVGDTWGDLSSLLNTNNHIDLYSTFNCFVLYKSEPIIKHNCKFKYMSDVLGTHDCDTVLICEEFRKNNYDKICLLPNKIVTHHF
jgi:hypothetical protein